MDDNQNNKELGLIDILQIMGQWLVALVKKLTDWFLYLLFFGVKRWKFFVIVGLVAGIYSVVMYKIQTSQYEANMIIRSNAVEATQMKNYLDAYANILDNDLIGDSIIQEKIGLDSLQRSLLTSVSAYYCIDEDRDGVVDEIDRAGRFKSSGDLIDSLNLSISIQFEDASIIPLVSKSIIDYISNIPYVVSNNNNRSLTLLKRRAFIKDEIALLDTLQQRTYKGLDLSKTTRVDNGALLVDNRKVIVYRDKLFLLEEADLIDKQLEVLAAPVTIVEDFDIGTTSVNSFYSIVRKNVVLALMGTYFFLFCVFLYKRVKDNYLN
ncbi:MAG: hypothetical protein PF444_03125 [Bacteroidales bacterium]|jgi:hypothetical protein|nr:hypothetical protein [Bacteroidales bacterium]